MTNLRLKLTTGIVAATFLAGVIAPVGAFAANDVTISGTGADSTNKVKIKSKNKTEVKQTNSTAVVNLVGVLQNTGGNKANKNSGGSVSIKTGDATATVTNTTTTGNNEASVDPCGCVDPLNTVEVKNTGADSKNKVKINTKNVNNVTQKNETLVVNGVLVGQNTGMNEANKNSGDAGSDPSIDTGDTDATVTNDVTTGGNVLNPSI